MNLDLLSFAIGMFAGTVAVAALIAGSDDDDWHGRG